MFNDSADQYPFGGDLHMSIFDNAVVGQKSIPLRVISKYHPIVFNDGCKRLPFLYIPATIDSSDAMPTRVLSPFDSTAF
jgi:hypothetical protein